MIEDKKTMEKMLSGFAEKKARQIFMKKFCINGSNFGNIKDRARLIPEQYVDEFFEMELPDVGEDSAGRQRVRDIRYAMGVVAEVYGRHKEAAGFYKAAGEFIGAIAQAKLAGLDKLVDEWSDEYCDRNDKRQSAHYALELGLVEKARHYMGEYLNENRSRIETDSVFCEEMASSAARYGLNKESEELYRKAMKMHEDNGNYDSALEIAKTLKDDEKIDFYSNARWFVADVIERNTIASKDQREKNG